MSICEEINKKIYYKIELKIPVLCRGFHVCVIIIHTCNTELIMKGNVAFMTTSWSVFDCQRIHESDNLYSVIDKNAAATAAVTS